MSWRHTLLIVGAIAAFGTDSMAQRSIDCKQAYVIRPGDTLRSIAVRATGRDDYREIWDLNRSRIGNDPNKITVGDRLQIPCPPNARSDANDQTNGANTAGANFEPAPDLARRDATQTNADQPNVVIVFNKASAPKFIINVGIIDPLFAEIERETAGRVTFVDPETIDRDPESQLQLVTSGTIDGAYIFNGHLSATHPLVQITLHPMIGGTAQQTAVALWRVHKQHFEDAGTFADVKLLGFIGAPPAHIWRVSDAPVDERERLINNNAWAVPYFDGLDTRGAKAVRAENAERIERLDGTDGMPPATFALAHGAARAVGVWTDARTVTEIDGGVYVPTFSVFISKEKWDQIGDDDKRTIERLTGEALALRSAAWDAFDNGHKAEMLRQGLKIAKADFEVLAELQDRARLGWEAWMAAADAKGISGYKALEAFFREMKALKIAYPG